MVSSRSVLCCRSHHQHITDGMIYNVIQNIVHLVLKEMRYLKLKLVVYSVRTTVCMALARYISNSTVGISR